MKLITEAKQLKAEVEEATTNVATAKSEVEKATQLLQGNLKTVANDAFSSPPNEAIFSSAVQARVDSIGAMIDNIEGRLSSSVM